MEAWFNFVNKYLLRNFNKFKLGFFFLKLSSSLKTLYTKLPLNVQIFYKFKKFLKINIYKVHINSILINIIYLFSLIIFLSLVFFI